jgi:hypothetical protein
MFVTCFYAILDPNSGRFTYANAGHDLPYLWHGGDAEELRARGMPLGLMPGMSYEEKELVLEPRDNVLLYSDGLVEAHDPKGEMVGFPRLRALVAEQGEEGSLGICVWRNSTLSLGRAGNRRMTSPSLRFGVPRPQAELLRTAFSSSSTSENTPSAHLGE